MRILITTGLSKADIGGPFQYAYHLEREFRHLGHQVKIVSYGMAEKSLPVGLRHVLFFFRIIHACFWAEALLILDTFSVGLPSVAAATLFGRKSVIRVGGDYVWSAYVNRTAKPIPLPAFYERMPKLNRKEKVILSLTKLLVRRTGFLAFNTEWQRSIWKTFYKIRDIKSGVVRNFVPEKREGKTPEVKNILWAGRVIPEKNLDILKKAGGRISRRQPQFRLDIITGEPHDKILERVRDCYAAVSVALTDICPNFILEAISFGKPFIMTRETGLNELYPRGGMFINPLSEEEIERAMEEMLVGEVYNKYVCELKDLRISHSWGEMAKEFIRIWQKI